MEQLKIHNIVVLVTQNELVLKDLNERELRLVPAQIEEARELVGALWRLSSLPAMPSTVPSRSGFFSAYLSPKEAEIRSINNVQENSGFRFNLSDCDLVIEAIDLGLNKLKDLFSLNPSPRALGTPSPPINSDVFDGRS